jgi:hypothetical protein
MVDHDHDPLVNPAPPTRPSPSNVQSAPAAIPSLTQRLSDTHITSPSSASTSQSVAKPKAQDEGYSSDEDTGIQMVDNDSDGELTALDCEPIPDDPVELPASQGSDPRESGKVMFEEQKSLGGFPKEIVRSTSGEGSGGRNQGSSSRGGGSGGGGGGGKSSEWSDNW